MIYSIILFIVLFVVIWLMHKPFNIHQSNSFLVKFHEILEMVLVMQLVIIINDLLKLIH